MKNKLLALIIILLFVCSAVQPVQNLNSKLDNKTDNKTDTTSITEQGPQADNTNDSVVKSTVKSTSIEKNTKKTDIQTTQDTWQSGQSIQVKTTPYNQYMHENTLGGFGAYTDGSTTQYIPSQFGNMSIFGSAGFTEQVDALMYGITIDDEIEICNPGIFKAYAYFNLKNSLPGTLHYVFKLEAENTPVIISQYMTGSKSITSSLIRGDYVSFKLWGYAEGDFLGSPKTYIELDVIKADGTTAILDSATTTGTTACYNQIRLMIDQIYITPNPYTQNIQSYYTYGSDVSTTHKINFEIAEGGADVVVYVPSDLTFSSISPVVDVTESGNTISFKSINTNQYEIRFSQKTNKILALEDVTDNYLSDPSFESGKVRNFITGESESTHKWDTVNTSTIQYKQGNSALRLYEDTSTATAIGIEKGTLDAGDYYLQFSYFIQKWDAGISIFRFYWADSETSYYKDIDATPSSTDTNAWVTMYYLIHVDESGIKSTTASNIEYQFYIYLYDSTGLSKIDIYMDDFKLFKPSGKINTTGYNEYELSASFICWDGLQNPAATNKKASIDFRDRTANTRIIRYSGTTDSYGRFSATYSGSLEQKEYEIRAYSSESWYGSAWTKEDTLDLSFWIYYYMATYSEEVINDYVHFTWTGSKSHGGRGYIEFQPSTYDTSQSDVFVWDMYSLLLDHADFYFYEDYSTGTSLYQTYDVNPTAWHTFDYSVDDLNEQGDVIRENIFTYRLMAGWNLTDASVDTYIRNFHSIISQKSYFTPNIADELATSFDFSYTQDEFSHSHDQNYIENEKGYLNFTANYDGAWARAQRDTNFTVSFESLRIRYRVSNLVSNDIVKIRNIIYDPYPSTSYTYYTLVNDDGAWHIQDTILTTSVLYNIDWYGVYPMNSTSSSTPYLRAGDQILYDYISFVSFLNIDLYETSNSFTLSSDNNTLSYAIWQDSNFLGYYNDLEAIGKNFTVGNHNLTYVPVFNSQENDFQIHGSAYSYTYTITNADLCTISIVDQQGQYIDARQYKIEVDSYRIYGDTFYLSDTTQTFNLTISDFWGNVLYQNLAEYYSRFIDLVLTLYSVKLYNQMDSPIYVLLSDGPTFSSWILPHEITEFKLKSDTYNFTLQYSSISGTFSAATLNGSKIELIYTVDSDNALIIDDFSIQDVYNNVVSLMSDLDATNSSIHTAIYQQTQNLTIQLIATDSNITLMSDNLTIIDSNMAGNFTLINSVLAILDSNLAGNFTATLLQIDLTNTTQVNLIVDNYNSILDDIEASKEYMSKLRIEDSTATFSTPSFTHSFNTNWQNSSRYIYINNTLTYVDISEGTYSFDLTQYGYYNITVFANATNAVHTYTFSQSYFVTWQAPSPADTVYTYFIEAVDLDGFRFADFPMFAYYDNYRVSNQLQIRGNETFDATKISFKDYWNTSYNVLDYNITKGIGLSYFAQFRLDIMKVQFQNLGDTLTRVNITDYSGLLLSSNISFLVYPQQIKNFWLQAGTYNYSVEVIKLSVSINSTSLNATSILSKTTKFLSSLSITAKLGDFANRIYDATGNAKDFVSSVSNSVSNIAGNSIASAITITLIISAVVFWLLRNTLDELWLSFRRKVLHKKPDEALGISDFKQGMVNTFSVANYRRNNNYSARRK